MKISTRAISLTALFTALICVLSPLTIPMPIGVPITLQTFIIAFAAFLLGTKYSAAAVICYILIGVTGLPVFSGFAAGAAALLSPTGGFIFAFPVYAVLLSLMFYVNKFTAKAALYISALAVLYISGTVQFIILTGTSAATAISAFILYFVKDAVLVFAAYLLCVRIRPGIIRYMHLK